MTRTLHVHVYHESVQAKIDQAAAASTDWLAKAMALQNQLTAAALAHDSRRCAVLTCEYARLANRVNQAKADLDAEITVGTYIIKPSLWRKLVRTTFCGDRVVAGGALVSRSLRNCFDPAGMLKPGLVITRHI